MARCLSAPVGVINEERRKRMSKSSTRSSVRYRSAVSGRYVTAAYARRHKRTTVRETRRK
jgi:hypothetical protein